MRRLKIREKCQVERKLKLGSSDAKRTVTHRQQIWRQPRVLHLWRRKSMTSSVAEVDACVTSSSAGADSPSRGKSKFVRAVQRKLVINVESQSQSLKPLYLYINRGRYVHAILCPRPCVAAKPPCDPPCGRAQLVVNIVTTLISRWPVQYEHYKRIIVN